MFKFRYIYVYLLLVVILAVGIVACENNASKIAIYQTETIDELPVSELEMTVGVATLKLAGGSGNYSVRANRDDLVKAWIANDYLYVKAKKTGLVDLVLVDDMNQSTTLKVYIQPKIRLFSVQDSRAEIEVEACSKEGKKAIGYIEDIIKGQLKTKGMYYKFIYEELDGGRVVIYPKGLIDEFKIEGTFKSHFVDSDQTLFEVNVNGLVRDYNLVETTGGDDFSLKKGLFIENYANDFAFGNVKIMKALGVEVVFFK